MGCQVCKSQEQDQLNTANSELSLMLKQSIISELPTQMPLRKMDIQLFPRLQMDTKWIEVPSIEFERNDEFILDHTTLKEIILVMTEKGNINVDIDNKKHHRDGKQKLRRIKMKDLEKEF